MLGGSPQVQNDLILSSLVLMTILICKDGLPRFWVILVVPKSTKYMNDLTYSYAAATTQNE